MRPGRLVAGALLIGLSAAPAVAQRLPAGVPADTLVLAGPAAAAPAAWRALGAGERVVSWVVEEGRAADPLAGGRPVVDAATGAVVASFDGSAWFAWPREPAVWVAPRAGTLVFGVNAPAGEAVVRPARLVAVFVGPPGSEVQRAFPPPGIELVRAAGGAVARYTDRAGFGLAPSTLRVGLVTNHGVRYDLAAWARPGARETLLPLPPPDLPLPPGIHTLSVTVEDRLGNPSPPATIVFHAP